MLANFSWLIRERIAGMGRPGGWGGVEQLIEEMELLRQQGIRAIVSLTEEALPVDLLQLQKMTYLHLPVADMQAPTLEDIAAFAEFVAAEERAQRPVVVHCGAGMGRTGTMLAAYLVGCGCEVREAIEQVRRQRPGSIETREQEAVLFAYAAYVKSKEKERR